MEYWPDNFDQGGDMKNSRCAYLALVAVLMVITTDAFPVTQQHGALGKITRMIVNHNANNDEIYITTDDPAPTCPAMVLHTNDPNVSPTSFKTLYSYLLVSKAMGKTLDFYTDLSCNLFRLEIIG